MPERSNHEEEQAALVVAVHPFEPPPVLWPEQEPLWAVDFTWVPQVDATGRPMLVPVGVQVRSFDQVEGQPLQPLPAGLQPVTRGLFKTLPMAALIERSRQALLVQLHEFVTIARESTDLLSVEAADALGSAILFIAVDDDQEPPKRGRRADRDPAFYRQVAALYEAAVRGGGEPARKPAKYVERRLRESGHIDDLTKPPQVRKFIQKARELGFLPVTRERQPGWTTGDHL